MFHSSKPPPVPGNMVSYPLGQRVNLAMMSTWLNLILLVGNMGGRILLASYVILLSYVENMSQSC